MKINGDEIIQKEGSPLEKSDANDMLKKMPINKMSRRITGIICEINDFFA